ncbi:MAG: 2OG-Fe(II) oxygenase [Betaproteobacteria bacterium]
MYPAKPQMRPVDFSQVPQIPLKKAECERIIKLFEKPSVEKVKGKINQDGEKVEHFIRQVEVGIIGDQDSWVCDLVLDIVAEANEYFEFSIFGLLECPQLLKYQAPNGGYDWHSDIGPDLTSCRKLSVSIILNDDFEGGEFEFLGHQQKMKIPKFNAIIFPSFISHKVHPVKKGTRWSLVSWVAGEPFR